ncbi:DcaP family trimeric outer membrane transporter [Chryseobacterium phocaeense]|uniref:DcaP family trimeric outer membrane transporter n=1 Tax=Chryseobacterium phocaeense TaxID=1816690 RepID=UPI0009BC70C1|nr:DcaP family trimeric outer membrane transporter [Chryseobacterium phocaeense]
MTKRKRNGAMIPAFATMALISIQTKTHAQITIANTPPSTSGKKWSAYLKGFIQADAMLDFQDVGFKDGFISPTIAIPQHHSISSHYSVKQSQIGIGIRQSHSSGDSGLSAYLEIDFMAPNGTTSPRFRQGYIQWKNWLAGQTWSNFADVDIFPNIFDFVGPNGVMLSRSFQIRYSKKLSEKGQVSFSLEDPGEISITTPEAHHKWKKKNLIPVLTALYRYGNSRDYIKAGGIVLPVNFENGKTYTATGFGGLISFRKSINSDNIRFQTSYGTGFSRNNQALSGSGYDAVFNPETNKLETLALFNIIGIYEHLWAPKWSSTAYYSYSQIGRKTHDEQEDYEVFSKCIDQSCLPAG